MADEWELIQQAMVDLHGLIDGLCRARWDRLSGHDLTVVARLHGHESDLARDVADLRRHLA